jgi:hypothetical protein
MLLHYEGVPVDPGFAVVALPDHLWRVCNNRFPPVDPNGLLAYVEKEERGLNIVLLRPGSAESLHADSLAAALSLISERCTGRMHG